jgi:uncharacterized protein (DUF1501 family)
MLPHDISTADALAQLSQPDNDPAGWSRRRFLQAMALGLGGAGVISAADAMGIRTALPQWLQEAWSAPPVGPSEGILVNVVMYGGNDGLNTLIPLDGDQNALYRKYRGGLAVAADKALRLSGSSVGLHPNLPYLKSLYDRGNVAVVQGVGYANPDFSHFNSMAIWMRGLNAAGQPTNGWLGRWLDGVGGYDAFSAATIGTSVPLHLIGQSRRATAVPTGANAFGTGSKTPDVRMFNGLRDYAAAPAGRGALHDAMAQVVRTQIDVARRVDPMLQLPLSSSEIVKKMTLAARLINADLGLRVIDVGWGDFDSHGQQLAMHPRRLAEFDAALKQFFINLDDRFRSRVTILTMSEFGRTPYANDSDGTDHGAASMQFVIGSAVKGGLRGLYPSLRKAGGAELGRWDDWQATVDFRSVFSAVLDGWLGGGGQTITNVAPLGGLFRVGPGEGVATGAPPAPAASDFTAISPVRVIDTRSGLGTWRRLPAGDRTTVEIDPLTFAHVAPAGVTAVALNLTAVTPSAAGWATAWATSTTQPGVSSMSFPAGISVPNLVVTKVGASSRVNVQNARGLTHFVADLVGVFRSTGGTRLVPVNPFRLLDTRIGRGAPLAKLGAARTINVQVTGVAGSGIPASGVDSVVLNVTATQPTAQSWMTVWPAGVARPNALNLAYRTGMTVANLVVAKVGTGGKVSFYNNAGATHVIADVVGYFSTAGTARFTPLAPARILDSRVGLGAAKALVGPTGIDVAVWGRGGVPSGARAAMLNVTVTGSTATGFLTVWPSGLAVPNSSNINYAAGQTIANAVMAKLGTNGRMRVNASKPVHVIGDVVGYFT